jgi:CheY-like chemotaxis protein
MTPPPAPSGGSGPAYDTPAGPLRVLVVDDDTVNTFMVARMLERLGHRAQVVGTGRAAAEATSGADFDVVLIDVQTPETDGRETARRVREAARGRGRRFRVLGMTTAGDEVLEERCRAAGMDGVLTRPFTLEALAAGLTMPGGRTTAGGDPVLDRERLAVLLGGDPEAVNDILRSFAEDAPRTLARLREALAVGDATGVERAAHRLKGALLWITADAAAAHAEAVERQARSGDLDGAGGTLGALARGVERVLEEARRGSASPNRGMSAFGTADPENDPEGSPGRGMS